MTLSDSQWLTERRRLPVKRPSGIKKHPKRIIHSDDEEESPPSLASQSSSTPATPSNGHVPSTQTSTVKPHSKHGEGELTLPVHHFSPMELISPQHPPVLLPPKPPLGHRQRKLKPRRDPVRSLPSLRKPPQPKRRATLQSKASRGENRRSKRECLTTERRR